ncbi:pseudaminic acid synthase [Helicobacter trogontum]|uniref:pseudaminic acid synthase n=1 Tax=Helicobacter trogontum TaxID=50960 RepID=UPI0034E8A388
MCCMLLEVIVEVPFIIAELSANHNQNLDIALQSVQAIAKTGANAIKVQTYKPSCLTLPYKNEYFRINEGLWKDSYLWDLYEDAQMPWEWHKEIFDLAHTLGLEAFSTPFSVEGVEFLEALNCPIYKIASFEVMHTPLLKAIAATKKPVILSLGVAYDNEIKSALEILRDNTSIALLYCISAYPASLGDARLTNIQAIKEQWKDYNVKVGLSDHTLGISVPIMATLCGASVIEKHFILDKSLGGVDSAFSLDVEEFRLMVSNVRDVCVLAQDFYDKKQAILPITAQDSHMASHLGATQEKKGRNFARSLFVSKDVRAGDIVSLSNIACVRPCVGMSPLDLDSILGKTFSKDIKGGMPLLESYINKA